MEIEEPIVAMIREMTRIPSTLKAWKPVVIEVLNDNRLFSAQSATAEKWKLIIRALFEADKTGFTDLLGKLPLQFLLILVMFIWSSQPK